MNIVDQFGKRKNGLTLDPKAPQMPAVSPPAKPVLHPETIRHLDDIKRTAERVAVLEVENATLQKNLDVSLQLCEEFKRLHDLAVADARHWEAYAVESRTIFQSFMDLAKRGHEHGKAAQDRIKAETAKEITPEQASTLVANVEAELIGSKFGPKENEPQ